MTGVGYLTIPIEYSQTYRITKYVDRGFTITNQHKVFEHHKQIEKQQTDHIKKQRLRQQRRQRQKKQRDDQNKDEQPPDGNKNQETKNKMN